MATNFEKYIINIEENRFNQTDISKSIASSVHKSSSKDSVGVNDIELVSIVNNIVNKHLGNVSSDWFGEFSLLSSIIDRNVNKLYCVSFVDGSDSFKGCIEKYITNIINILYSKRAEFNGWWFHNPEAFIAPSGLNVLLTISEDYKSIHDNCDALHYAAEIATASEENIPNEYKAVANVSDMLGRNDRLFASAMTHPRTFKSIMAESQEMYNYFMKDGKSQGVDELRDHYYTGITLARRYYDYFICKDGERYGYLTFPILPAKATNVIPDIYSSTYGSMADRLQGQGHFYVYFKIDDPDFDHSSEKTTHIVQQLYKEINDTLNQLAFNYAFNTGYTLYEAAIRESATKSAKAAIMSRNMSHNLGSHVMSYIKQNLNSVQSILDHNILGKLTSVAKGEQNVKIDTDELALPFLVGLGRFVSYLQERQDFIATIATDYAPYYAAVNFKEFIYDELNPDLRYERHNNECRRIQPDNILLGNIAKSEGLSREALSSRDGNSSLHDIVLSFRGFNGCKNSPAKDSLDQMRDYEFSMPGGVVGRQAFFSIVENIIRNAAKHGSKSSNSQQDLELKIDIFSSDEFEHESTTRRIEEFKAIYDKYYKDAKDIDNLYIVTITDNRKIEDAKVDGAISKLRAAIIEPYITSNGDMVNANKGIKEIRISTAWLRSQNENLDSSHPYYLDPKEATKANVINSTPAYDNVSWSAKGMSAPILLANIIPCEDGTGGYLQYSFCVEKLKNVTLITTSTRVNELKEIITDRSWSVVSVDNYLLPTTNKSSLFVVVDADIPLVDYLKMRRVSHSRFYRANEIGAEDVISQLINSNNIGETCLKICSQLNEHLSPIKSGDKITISDEKSNGHKWIDKDLIDIVDGSSGKYTYRKHFESKAEFNSYMRKRPVEAKYIEGITGNNSTDRLIRNDELNTEWAHRHLHSMQAKVAIFDERIFSNVYKIDQAKIKSGGLPLVSVSLTVNNLDDYLAAQMDRLIETYDKESTIPQKELYSVATVDDLNNLIKKYSHLFGTSAATNADYMSIAFNLKGIDLFSIIEANDRLEIYGYNGYGENGVEEGFVGHCALIGSISKSSDGNYKVVNEMNNFEDGGDSSMKYDYISIHQGLLDKIYNMLGIKDNPAQKHELLKCFYLAFSTFAEEEIIEYKDRLLIAEEEIDIEKCYFLPQMYIHSGRSKPSFADMPQKLPFIQYAAIEQAVLDCKYSLVELLDFARYE